MAVRRPAKDADTDTSTDSDSDNTGNSTDTDKSTDSATDNGRDSDRGSATDNGRDSDRGSDSDHGGDSDCSGDSDKAAARRRLSAARAGQAGLRQIIELTGKDPEGVSGVEPSDDGWRVTVDVVEDRRIPSTTDLLATYRVELDPDGELLSYQRVRRYSRGRGDDGDR
jgi:hypothetical protein